MNKTRTDFQPYPRPYDLGQPSMNGGGSGGGGGGNGTVYYHNGVPYTYQNGMAMFTADGQPIGGVVSPTTHTGNGLRGAEQFRDKLYK